MQHLQHMPQQKMSEHKKIKGFGLPKPLYYLVDATGFEPATSAIIQGLKKAEKSTFSRHRDLQVNTWSTHFLRKECFRSILLFINSIAEKNQKLQ